MTDRFVANSSGARAARRFSRSLLWSGASGFLCLALILLFRLTALQANLFLPLQIGPDGTLAPSRAVKEIFFPVFSRTANRLTCVNGHQNRGTAPRRLSSPEINRITLGFSDAAGKRAWLVWEPEACPAELFGPKAGLEPKLKPFLADVEPSFRENLRLRKINNQPFESVPEFFRPLPAGAHFVLESDAGACVVLFLSADAAFTWLLYGMGILIAALGLMVYFIKGSTPITMGYLLFTLAIGSVCMIRAIPAFARSPGEAEFLVWSAVGAQSASVYMLWSFIRSSLSRSNPRTAAFIFSPTILLILFRVFFGLDAFVTVFLGAAVLSVAALLLPFWNRAALHDELRRRIRFIRGALILSFAPLAAYILARWAHPRLGTSGRFLAEAPGILFPVLLGIGVVRRNILNVPEMARGAFRYLSALLAAAAAYAVCVAALLAMTDSFLGGREPRSFILAIGAGVFISAPLMIWISKKLREKPPAAISYPTGQELVPLRMMRDEVARLSHALMSSRVSAFALPRPGAQPLWIDADQDWLGGLRESIPGVLLRAGRMHGPCSVEELGAMVDEDQLASLRALDEAGVLWVAAARPDGEALVGVLAGAKIGLATYHRQDLITMTHWLDRFARASLALQVKEERRAGAKTENLLRESERRLRLLVENATDIIFRMRLHPDLSCEYVSPSVSLHTRRPVEALMMRPGLLLAMVCREDRFILRNIAADPEGAPSTFEIRMRGPGGKILWMEVNLKWETSNLGTLVAVEGIARDISERKRLEREREFFGAQLRQSQKLEALGTLVAGIAHDFNNVITAIQGFAAEAQRRQEMGASPISEIENMSEAAEQARGITRALLTYARQSHPQKKLVRLWPLVEGAIRVHQRFFPASISIRQEPPNPAQEIWVHVDEGQINQALLNLLINARDAMTEGGVVTISLNAMISDGQRDLQSAGPRAILTISDTGPGIPLEIQERIFEPFFTTKPRERGTGLGLSMAHAIIEGHGGRIYLNPMPKAGAAFVVELPAMPPEVRIESLVDDHIPFTPRGELILLAEDNAHIQRVGAARLTAAGYRVITASDGEELLANALGPALIDLCIVDLDLPKKKGLDCIREILAARPGAAILAVTGNPDSDLAEIEGAVPLLRKPFSLNMLTAQVAKILLSHRAVVPAIDEIS